MPHARSALFACLSALFLAPVVGFGGDNPIAWPPELKRAGPNGSVTVESDLFLEVPRAVQELRDDPRAAPFVMAKTPPKVDFAWHRNLGPDAVNRRLWSSWGDICVASDGSVYCGIGDHGDDAGGDARCFLYRWDPQSKTLTQIVDARDVVPPREGQPAWSKVHARIDEGPDGGIYFSFTLNAGSRAGQEKYHWNEKLPGGQIYRYEPETGKTTVFANLPPKRCTATSVIDRKRGVWWCNLEAGDGDALWGLDLQTKEVVARTPDGTVAFNRAFALAQDGSIYFNAEEGRLGHLDPRTGKVRMTKSAFPDSPGMRSATRESRDGSIYGTTHKSSRLYRYEPARDELTLLGPNWMTGMYTTVSVLSPDEKYVYYLPGAHGKAWTHGTPVVQYEIATGRRKVLAFLAEAFEDELGYVPGGTYGIKLSADGGTLYVNLNGHAADPVRPDHMKPIGFGLTSFAAIRIPAMER